MTLGEKIKALRKSKNLTQKALAGTAITRNMLSRIENDAASPSLETLRHIADKLGISVSLLLSEESDAAYVEKASAIKEIYTAYKAKSYNACIKLIDRISEKDDELNFILASAYFEAGREALFGGALLTAKEKLLKAKSYSSKTALSTDHIESLLPMYLAIAQNVQSPLLEFNPAEYERGLNNAFDIEFYRYVSLDTEYEYTSELLQEHIAAKKLLRQKNYKSAIEKLSTAADRILSGKYNAFIVFGIYTDLEACYRQLCDYENAYRYASKRLSLLEGFKS